MRCRVEIKKNTALQGGVFGWSLQAPVLFGRVTKRV